MWEGVIGNINWLSGSLYTLVSIIWMILLKSLLEISDQKELFKVKCVIQVQIKLV